MTDAGREGTRREIIGVERVEFVEDREHDLGDVESALSDGLIICGC